MHHGFHDGDILNRSRYKIFQVENAQFVVAKCLTISTALDYAHYKVRGECLCHLHWFPMGLPCYWSGFA